jgi:hypothetical protein
MKQAIRQENTNNMMQHPANQTSPENTSNSRPQLGKLKKVSNRMSVNKLTKRLSVDDENQTLQNSVDNINFVQQKDQAAAAVNYSVNLGSLNPVSYRHEDYSVEPATVGGGGGGGKYSKPKRAGQQPLN